MYHKIVVVPFHKLTYKKKCEEGVVLKDKLSIVFMKLVRRIVCPLQEWYRYYLFVSGLESYQGHVAIEGDYQLWCDHVHVGEYVHIYPGVTLWGPGKISIGSHVEIGINSVIYASQEVEIGDNVLIAAHCYIIDSNHGIAKEKLIREQTSIVKGRVCIEDDVWLGAGVKVLSGVHIGRGAVIGAQAVVNCDIPEYAIAVGCPARVIGYRK